MKHTRACFRCKLVKTYEQVRARPPRPGEPPDLRGTFRPPPDPGPEPADVTFPGSRQLTREPRIP